MEIDMPTNSDKKITLTIRLTEDEKQEADACVRYLGPPLSTFFRFATKQLFNDNRQSMMQAGFWNDQNPNSVGESFEE